MKRRDFLLRGIAGLTAGLHYTGSAARSSAHAPHGAPPGPALASFSGTPHDIGLAYGVAFSDAIKRNMGRLVRGRLPSNDPNFSAWVRKQEGLIRKYWPWYIEEMHGVAEGIAGRYEDILLLNLRAWQYDLYGMPPADACSSLAITLANGFTACAGSLDDPSDLYCGPVRFAGDTGYRMISFPITGTSWCNRGMNSAGLVMSISSQVLPGLKRSENTVVQDIAMRAILHTCASVKDVRNFCREHPFVMNMVCIDANGDIFCAQHTSAGLREIPVRDACAVTNHIIQEKTRKWLRRRGVHEFPQSETTVARRARLLQYIAVSNRKCTAKEVKDWIAYRDDAVPGSIHNKGSIFLTYACPQAEKTTLWIMQPGSVAYDGSFMPFQV